MTTTKRRSDRKSATKTTVVDGVAITWYLDSTTGRYVTIPED